MDTKTQKIRSIIFYTLEFTCIAFVLFFIGSGNVVSPVFGDINLIDEGQYGAWLSHMLHGLYLYKNMYAAYGPFYIFPLYLLGKIFGPSVFLIRILYMVIDSLLAIAIITLVFIQLKVKKIWQLLAILLLFMIPANMRIGMGYLSILLVYKAINNHHKIWSILAGVCIVSSFLVSSEIGIFSFILWALLMFFTFVLTKNLGGITKKLILMLASGLFVSLVFFIWATHEGWFYTYITSIIYDLFTYVGQELPIGQNFPNAIAIFPHHISLFSLIKYLLSRELLLYWVFLLYIILFLYISVRVILRKYAKNEVFFILISIYGFFLGSVLIGRPGHWEFAFPPVFVIIAYLLSQLSAKIKNEKNYLSKIVVVFLIFVLLVFPFRIISLFRPHFISIFSIPKSILAKKTNLPFVGPIAISKAQEKSFITIQDFFQKNSTRRDKIFFFNNEPLLYLLVDRDNATNYDLPEEASIFDKRLELLSQLEKNKPKFIVDDLTAWPPDGISNKQRLPEVWQFMQSNYTKKALDNFIIYTIKK